MNGSAGQTLGNNVDRAKLTLTTYSNYSTITIDFTDTSIDGYKPYVYRQDYQYEMMYING